MGGASTPGAGPTLPLRFRYPVVVLVAVLLPGIASLMLRGWREVGLRSLLLLAAIPVALFVFGPLWDGVIFATSSRAVRNAGLWPFLAICVAVLIFSVWRAIQDRRVVIARLEASAPGGSIEVRQTRSESFGYGCFVVAALFLAIRFLALPAMFSTGLSRASPLAQIRAANTTHLSFFKRPLTLALSSWLFSEPISSGAVEGKADAE